MKTQTVAKFQISRRAETDLLNIGETTTEAGQRTLQLLRACEAWKFFHELIQGHHF